MKLGLISCRIQWITFNMQGFPPYLAVLADARTVHSCSRHSIRLVKLLATPFTMKGLLPHVVLAEHPQSVATSAHAQLSCADLF